MFPTLKAVRDSLENSYFHNQKAVEDKALSLYAENKQMAIDYLNNYGIEKAQQMIDRWRQLATFLIVKFNDMAVKPTETDGTFKRTKTGIGARVARPGYSEYSRKELVRQTGDKYAYPN